MALADLFGDIADAIREKDGTTAPIAANHFPGRMRSAVTCGAEPDAKTYTGAEGLLELFSDIAATIRTLDGTTGTIIANKYPERFGAIPVYEEKTEIFTTSCTWTVPAVVTSVSVVCIGGGGGGGGCGGGYRNTQTGKMFLGGYGQGGKRGVLNSGNVSVAPGAEIAVTVGSGGMRGYEGSSYAGTGGSGGYGMNGEAGMTSSFGSFLSAAGGAGGQGGQGASAYANGYPTKANSGESGYADYGGAGGGGDSGAAGAKGAVIVTYRARPEQA